MSTLPRVPVQYTYVDGAPIYLRHAGPTTLPGVLPPLVRGYPVLCLHGSGGNSGYHSDLIEALAANHSPLAFDQPGHGRSGGLDSLGSVERMALLTRALVQKLGISRPVLLGHSLGGAVALRYALDSPDELRAIVLCGSAARFGTAPEMVEGVRRVTQGRERRAFLRDAFSPKTSDEVVRRGWREDMKTDPRVILGDLLAAQAWDVTAELGAVRVPTLVLVGEDEHPRLKAQAELLSREIPGARMRTFPEAGHALPLEQPHAVAEAVSEFLGGLPE